MPDVRTTNNPGTVITVGDHEYTDLDRMGLILEVVTTSPDEMKTPVRVESNKAGSKTAKPEPEEA